MQSESQRAFVAPARLPAGHAPLPFWYSGLFFHNFAPFLLEIEHSLLPPFSDFSSLFRLTLEWPLSFLAEFRKNVWAMLSAEAVIPLKISVDSQRRRSALGWPAIRVKFHPRVSRLQEAKKNLRLIRHVSGGSDQQINRLRFDGCLFSNRQNFCFDATPTRVHTDKVSGTRSISQSLLL